MAAPPHFPPPTDGRRTTGTDGPYRAVTTSDPPPRAPSIGADDVEWVEPDPQVARLLAATAGMHARSEHPWIGRLASALAIAAAWGMRGRIGAVAWVVIVTVLAAVLVIEVRRVWRASDVER